MLSPAQEAAIAAALASCDTDDEVGPGITIDPDDPSTFPAAVLAPHTKQCLYDSDGNLVGIVDATGPHLITDEDKELGPTVEVDPKDPATFPADSGLWKKQCLVDANGDMIGFVDDAGVHLIASACNCPEVKIVTTVPPGPYQIGDAITKTHCVINNSANIPLVNYTVSLDTGDTVSPSTPVPGPLAPGAKDNQFTSTHIATQADVDLTYVTCLSTVTAEDEDGNEVSDCDSVTVPTCELDEFCGLIGEPIDFAGSGTKALIRPAVESEYVNAALDPNGVGYPTRYLWEIADSTDSLTLGCIEMKRSFDPGDEAFYEALASLPSGGPGPVGVASHKNSVSNGSPGVPWKFEYTTLQTHEVKPGLEGCPNEVCFRAGPGNLAARNDTNPNGQYPLGSWAQTDGTQSPAIPPDTIPQNGVNVFSGAPGGSQWSVDFDECLNAEEVVQHITKVSLTAGDAAGFNAQAWYRLGVCAKAKKDGTIVSAETQLGPVDIADLVNIELTARKV